MKLNIVSILKTKDVKLKDKRDTVLVRRVSGGAVSEVPKKVELNTEVSWMMGVWTGDNFGKKGTMIYKNERTSGRFGINVNDEELVMRFLKGLKKEFKITKIKIDVQTPRNQSFDKEKLRSEVSRKFNIEPNNINIYNGSEWRRNIGYAVYTNNTPLLRIVRNEIYDKLPEHIEIGNIDISAYMQGIVDSEGDVDKANKNIGITNKDNFVIQVISLCLKKLRIPFSKRVDNKERTNFEIKDIKNFQKLVDFYTKRKQIALQEMLEGNFAREKDKQYFPIFVDELKIGTTALKLHQKFGIPHSTVKMVLRNLASGNILKRKKVGRAYVYFLP